MPLPYRVVDHPIRIAVSGGKRIEEYFGRVRTGQNELSLAHMIAPPGWAEPAQKPDFAEVTVMVRGAMRIELGELGQDVVELRAGQAIWIEPHVRVRYSNPYEEENEYFSICLPAFSPELAHRDSEGA